MMRRIAGKRLGLLLSGLAYLANAAIAQELSYTPLAADDPGIGEAMRSLAEQALQLPDTSDEAAYATNRAALQMAAGNFELANASYAEARRLRLSRGPVPGPGLIGPSIYAAAKASAPAADDSFKQAFVAAYSSNVAALSNREAFDVSWFFLTHPNANRRGFLRVLQQRSSATKLSLVQAVELVRLYAWWRASEELWPHIRDAVAADDAARYVVDEDVRVRTPDGATVTGILVRPRGAAKVPTLLHFSIYPMADSIDEARRTATYGYAGLIGFTRGKYRSPDKTIPWDHSGVDGRAMIEWVAQQAWSDGRVGMYGGSYDGNAQWSVLKQPPAALKAAMPSASGPVGLSGPMEGNIFLMYQYSFVPYVTNGQQLDEAVYGDRARWSNLEKEWYRSGRPYRELDRIDGKPNPLYMRMLDHPSYDGFWQRYSPQGKEFSRVNIPVLITTGYFDGAQIGARYYFEQLAKHNPRGDLSVVIGPYSHFGAQHQSDPVVVGYAIDPVARLDVYELRYAWFNHLFRGGPKPVLLKDRVNYQVMGANEWRHAPSFDAMQGGALKLYLRPGAGSDQASLAHLASEAAPSAASEIVIDFADRTDVDWLPPSMGARQKLDTKNSLAFVSEPMNTDTDVTGVLRAVLDFETNKKDMDLVMRLYEQDAAGGYIELSMPYIQRASYAADPSRRKLLKPGVRHQLVLAKPGAVARRVKAGHRIVLLLGIQKQRDAQLNYGSGKDVSDESIADASAPMRVRWFGSSYLSVPLAP
jgi:uncharacterized protein